MSQKILRTMQDDLTEIQDTKTGRRVLKKPEPEKKTDLPQKPLPQQQANLATVVFQTKTPARNIPAKTERGNFADIKGNLEKKGFSVSLPPSLQEEKKDKKENNFFARLQEKITERKEVPLAEPPVQAEKRTEKPIIEEVRKTERIVKPEEIEKLKAAETIKQNAEERKKIEEIRRFAELEKIKETRGEEQDTTDHEDAGIKKEILEEVRRGDEKIKEDLLSQIQKQEEARRREIQKAMEDVKRQEEMRKQEENKASEALKAQETRISNILKEVSNSLIQGEVKAEESKKAIIEEMRTKVLEEEKKNKEAILAQIQKQEEMRTQEVQKAQEELKRQESLRSQEAKMAQQALREEDAKRAEEATRLREAIKSQEADIANLIKLTSDPLTKEDIVEEMRVKFLEEEKRNKEDILAQMKAQEVQLSDFMKEISATLQRDTPKKEEIEQEIIAKIREEERKNKEDILAQFKEQNVRREEEIGKLQETIRAKDAQIANLTKGISDSMQEGTERGETEERLIAEMKAKITELEEAKKRELDILNQIKEEESGQQEETAKQTEDEDLKQEERKRLEEENERTIREEKEQAAAEEERLKQEAAEKKRQAETEERAAEEMRSRQEEENRIKEEDRLRQEEAEEKRQEAIKIQAAEEEEEKKRQEAAQKAEEEEEQAKEEALPEEKPEENASEIQPDSDTDTGAEEKTDSSEAFWDALRKSKRSDLAGEKEPSQADDSILSDFKANADTPPSEEKAATEIADKETIAPSAQDEEIKNLIKRVSNSMETSARDYSDQPREVTEPDKDKDLKDLLARMSSSLQKEKSTAEEYPKEALPAEQNNTKTDNESTGLLEKINADKSYWEKIQNTIKEPAINPQQRVVGTANISAPPYNKPAAYAVRPEDTGLIMPDNIRTAQQRIRERKQENSSYVDPENRLIHGKQEFYSTMHKAIKPRTEKGNLDGLDDVLKEKEIELSEGEKEKKFKQDIAKKYGTKKSAPSRIKVAVAGIVFLAILGGFLTVILPKLKSAKNTATTEKSTTIVAGESIADIDKKIIAAPSVKQSQVMTLNYFDANLDPWKSFSNGDVIRLNIIYDNQDVMLSREEALKTILGENNASNIPEDFMKAISPEYNILVFKDNGYLRLGLVFKYTASKEEEFKDIMSRWAGTNTQSKKIYTVMKSIFVNSRIIEQGTTTFQPAIYNGTELRFVNLPDSDTSMDYFLYEGYIIFTSSKDHTFQMIDLLKK